MPSDIGPLLSGSALTLLFLSFSFNKVLLFFVKKRKEKWTLLLLYTACEIIFHLGGFEGFVLLHSIIQSTVTF
jgi:hypothetical protein